jgi:molybdopterin synthase catalytic subunit
VRTWITTDSLDGFSAFDAIAEHSDGAVVIFQGRVREVHEGRAVARLDYEAYEEMAERELRAICLEAAGRSAVGAIVAAHRVGALALGEVSVSIGVAAPHRDAAYEASRYVIEEIKKRLPVWKHEHFADGRSVWVGAPADLSAPAVGPEAPA